MMKEIIIFTVGAAVGGAAVWFYQERKYETLINDEIESVKEAFNNRPTFEEIVEEVEDEVTDVSESLQELADKARNKVNIFEYQNEVEKHNYAKYSEPEKKEEKKEEIILKKVKPYTIDQGDFREYEDYGHLTMDYYTDNVLADADHPDVPISDISDYVGDCLKHVSEDRADDWIYVRNENKKVDIEIFINDKPFSEREDE